MEDSLDTVLEPLRKVLDDLVAWYPGLTSHASVEFEKIRRLCNTRGLEEVLYVALPSAGKHLDYCLSRGFLASGYPETLGSLKRGSLLFYELYYHIFGDCYTGSKILPNADPNAIFFIRQILYLYKKITLNSPIEAVKLAVGEFLSIEEGLRPPSLDWNSSPEDFAGSLDRRGHYPMFSDLLEDLVIDRAEEPPLSSIDTRLLGIMDEVVFILSNMVEPIDVYSLIPKHGPGAVADLQGDDKYTFPSWSVKLDSHFPEEYFAYSSEEVANQSIRDIIEITSRPAKLHAVAKTYDKPRLITIEPTANQFLQQGLLKWIRNTLPSPLRHCIDFSNQDLSRELVIKASSDQSLATLDLSSASDRLTCWTVERVFHSYGGVLPFLYASRSVEVFNGTAAVDLFKSIQLKKFAGMGSAVTFPVQSIVYAICCIAAEIASEYGLYTRVTYSKILEAAKGIRVFGDDLMLPKTSVPYLSLIFDLLELKINVGKSHVEGNFRESCGMDSFNGHDVTPLYLDAFCLRKGPRALVSWVDVGNNAYRKGLWHLASWMRDQISVDTSVSIPVSDTLESCITHITFMRGISFKGKVRYFEPLQRFEIKGYTLRTLRKTIARGNYQDLLQYFLEARPYWESEFLVHKQSKLVVGFMVEERFKLKRSWVPLLASTGTVGVC